MFAVVDIETTGGGGTATDRLAEIAVIVFDGTQVVEQFHSLVNPCREMDPWVSKLTGITQDMLVQAPRFEEIATQVYALLQSKIFTAHNVKFDFGILRKEFKRVGIDFKAKQLDTVSFSRKVFPGLPSYSLGKLCEQIGIPIENRHRALGDATATVKLLELLLATDVGSRILESELKEGLEPHLLPPSLAADDINILPDEAGIFYFKNDEGSVLYQAAAKNIKKEVINELRNSQSYVRRQGLIHHISSIDYEPTGNLLIARLILLEREQPSQIEKISSKQPEFNYGIFITEDSSGLKQLKVQPLKDTNGKPLISFTGKKAASEALRRIILKNNLQNYFGLYKRLSEKKADTEKIKRIINEKTQEAIRKSLAYSPNFFLLGEGVHPDENSVVWVENNEYRGYGFYNKEFFEPTPEKLVQIISKKTHHPEAIKIIRQHLRKSKTQGIVAY
ncbi:MAG: exonuclease domain-containing protein [Chitinophagales bacterium]|nr:exonuclease domain-containing protein [Chitinophagales bacterium]MDW8273877.1 exonuclease domain-containing protein [Chitinophagales bacterium]